MYSYLQENTENQKSPKEKLLKQTLKYPAHLLKQTFCIARNVFHVWENGGGQMPHKQRYYL